MACKKCFKVQHELVDNLNVAFDLTNRKLVFWNKFQIFIMNEQDLATPGHLIDWGLIFYYTDFEIYQLILAEHLLCLDYEGNVFTYSPNLRQPATFQRLEDNILCMEWYDDLLFSIQLEMGKMFIRVDKIKSTDSVLVKSELYSKNKITIKLLLSELKREKCILHCYKIDGTDMDSINQIFKGKKNFQSKQFIIIMSFDKLTLYAMLVDLELNSKILKPVTVITCPSEINSIVVLKENFLNLIVCLSAGTVIKQPLNNNVHTPQITHLNTAIHRCAVLTDKIIYTDGSSMWVSTNTFSEPDAKLRQLFVKNVKDFIQIAGIGTIICTTYSNLIYTFNVKDESSYLVPIAANEYYSTEHLFNNMNYLHRIMEEVERNDEIIKNIKREENYITTLALSNRQDIMNEMIKYSIIVYENYEDILKEGLVLNLTNNLKDYFDKGSFYFLLKIHANLQQNFDDVLENIFTDSKLHITILSERRIIKTLTVKVTDQLKIYNIVVPLRMKRCNVTDLCFDIKIVKKIPKMLNCKQYIWTALYSKKTIVTPEHFIKTNSQENVRPLKDPEDSIENLLYKTVCKYHGQVFKITKVSEDPCIIWSFYIKLPKMYKELLQNEIFYKEHFNSTKTKFLLRAVSSEEFLNTRKSISFLVLNEKFDMEIVNEGISNTMSNMIKVSSENPLLALGIRNFFSNLIHNNYRDKPLEQEFLSCFEIISTLEKTEKAVKKCLDEQLPFEEFCKIYEQFQINLCETLV